MYIRWETVVPDFFRSMTTNWIEQSKSITTLLHFFNKCIFLEFFSDIEMKDWKFSYQHLVFVVHQFCWFLVVVSKILDWKKSILLGLEKILLWFCTTFVELYLTIKENWIGSNFIRFHHHALNYCLIYSNAFW